MMCCPYPAKDSSILLPNSTAWLSMTTPEYHDNEGVESISDIADNLLNPTYRKAIIKALQDKQEYYAEDEFDDAHIAERATDILDNLAEIFGSDEQED